VKRRARIGRYAAALATVLLSSAASPAASPPATVPDCTVPAALIALDAKLDHSAARIGAGKSVTILALGSSSTQGVGASSPVMSYPSRLERALEDMFPAVPIRVVNDGRGGQDVGDEYARLNHDIVAEHPDLVIWQVGTNAVLRHDNLAADEGLIMRGVDVMRRSGIDVVLMDLQYAPRVLTRPAWSEMEQRIAEIAKRAQVGRLRRFEIMREWDRTGQLAPTRLIADRLAQSLAEYWRGTSKLAKSRRRNPDAVAGGDRPLSQVPR
jgi:acyl-CoA thioesterase I